MLIRSATELGRLVKERRQQRHLTQAQLAARVGASRKWVIDLEAGKRTAELSLTLRTLTALGLCLDVRERPSRTARGSVDINAIVDATKRRD